MRLQSSSLLLAFLPQLTPVLAATPFLTIHNSTSSSISNGDTLVMNIASTGYTYSYVYNGIERVNTAKGGYTDTGGKTTFNFTGTPPKIVMQNATMIDVAYEADLGIVHYVFFSGLSGHYQYVVNKNLGNQGEVRSLYRFDPLQFSHGRTNIKDAPLPLLADILKGYKVQDETWQRPDGTYITKYDFSCFVRDLDFHGLYGPDVGAWIIAPGKDYYIGDQLKQELMLHRESVTNDSVMLHMYHGSHYNSVFSNYIPPGKMWGPWLLYFNDGSIPDASTQAAREVLSWPYTWLNDTNYRNRGSVSGKLVLSDGRPAAGAAVFLGDRGNTNNQGSTYQYTSYADNLGNFNFMNVRREKTYTMQAWSNGGSITDVQTVFVHPGINVTTTTKLGTLTWPTSGLTPGWQIGDFDRKTLGFQIGGEPLRHGLTDRTPANLVYAIGTNKTNDWFFAQSAMGNWTVLFDAPAAYANRSGTLSLSFAGYTSQNGYGLGHDSATLPEQTPVGLNVSMNENFVGTIVSTSATDGAIYRSATTAGGYYFTQMTIPQNTFIAGNNRLDLSLTQNHRWRGIMWDALKFEWN